MSIDNRVYKRFSVQEDVFVTFNDNYSSGKVIDLSHGGLSFQYLLISDETKSGFSSRAGIDIWTPRNNFHISNIPCEIVYDIKENSMDDGLDYEFRRCGMKFLYTDRYILSEIDRMYYCKSGQPQFQF